MLLIHVYFLSIFFWSHNCKSCESFSLSLSLPTPAGGTLPYTAPSAYDRSVTFSSFKAPGTKAGSPLAEPLWAACGDLGVVTVLV